MSPSFINLYTTLKCLACCMYVFSIYIARVVFTISIRYVTLHVSNAICHENGKIGKIRGGYLCYLFLEHNSKDVTLLTYG